MRPHELCNWSYEIFGKLSQHEYILKFVSNLAKVKALKKLWLKIRNVLLKHEMKLIHVLCLKQNKTATYLWL